jgi:hypothetical protein
MNVGKAVLHRFVEIDHVYDSIDVAGALYRGAARGVSNFGERTTLVPSGTMGRGLTVLVGEGAKQHIEEAGLN